MTLNDEQQRLLKEMLDNYQKDKVFKPKFVKKPKKVLPKRHAMIKKIMCSHCPELNGKKTQLGTVYVTKYSHISRLDFRCYVCHEFTTVSQEMLETE